MLMRSRINIKYKRIKLSLGLQQINSGRKYDEVLFWGRIEGTKKDYYIAIAL